MLSFYAVYLNDLTVVITGLVLIYYKVLLAKRTNLNSVYDFQFVLISFQDRSREVKEPVSIIMTIKKIGGGSREVRLL